MSSLSDLAHRSNDDHARGRHNPKKKINHKVNYKNAVFRSVTLFRKFEKCCNDFSCEDCKKAKRDAMKLKQVKAISISPLHYEQTGTKTLQWPPLPLIYLDHTGTQPDEPYQTGSCHFLFTGMEKIIDGRKRFVPEHMDGPVIDKKDDKFEDQMGNVYDFISGSSASASEMEEMKYYGTATDNNLFVGPPRKKIRTALKETKEEKAKLEKEKATTVQFLSHKLLVDDDGNNLLHQAALEGKNQNVRVFLENKLFELEAKNDLGETALHCALKVENDEAFRLLRDFGADMSQTFLDKNGKICSSISTDKNGNNLLHQAVLQNDITDVIMCLESKNFDVEAKNKKEETALHCALKVENDEAFRLLRDYGSDLSQTFQNTNGKFYSLILIDEEGNNLLHQLALKNDVMDVTMLLEKHTYDLEAKNKAKKTALHCAARTGNIEVVNLLLEKGAKLEAKDKDGNTPLFHAIICGHKQVVEQLFISGADLEARNKRQKTPLHLESYMGNPKSVQLILERKPNLLEAKDEDGENPLFTAIRHQHEQVAEQLIISGADLEARNKYQENLLHCASSRGNIKIVKLLLEKNPDLLQAKDEDGNTPYNIAEKFEEYEVLTLLQNASANLNATKKAGETRFPLIAVFK